MIKQLQVSIIYVVSVVVVALFDKYVLGGDGHLSPVVVGALVVCSLAAIMD